jgi:DNA integrity scanning protein DisA with diadenylate cyclase activity
MLLSVFRVSCAILKENKLMTSSNHDSLSQHISVPSCMQVAVVGKPPSQEFRLSIDDASLMLSKCAFQLAKSLGVNKVVVQAGEVQNPYQFELIRDTQVVIWLVRTRETNSVIIRKGDHVLELPQATYTRENQLKVGMLLAALSGLVEIDENVVCLSGIARSGTMDTLFIANPKRDFPWFRQHTLEELRNFVATREFVGILGVALRLANEGREGRPIGTCFALGDPQELEPHVRQLLLNPLAGHPEHLRDIHNPDLFETIREFATLDGAFVVGSDGIVHSAGTYLNAQSTQSSFIPGLGARHAAARSITEVTTALAIVVSSSSGTVSVFHGGQLVLELEKSEMRTPVDRTKKARKF